MERFIYLLETRAIHIEVTDNFSTDSFLNAYTEDSQDAEVQYAL